MNEVSDGEVEKVFARLTKDAQKGGYHLNPDAELTKDLIRGFLINEKRYGYRCCPCRLAAEDEKADLDINMPRAITGMLM